MAIIVTLIERLMDDWRRKQSRGKSSWQTSKENSLFFLLLMRENFMLLSYSSSFFLFGHVKEHESQSDPQQVRPGGSWTAGRGFSQATFSCDAHNAIKNK